MSLFSKLFGQKPKPVAPRLKPPPASPPPPGAPAMLKAWDAYGRTCEIPREAWRTQVLPVNFQNAWNKPDDLAALIGISLNDGFVADCLEPARHLHRIDTQPKRGATFLAAILLQLKKFVEAECIIKDALALHGEDGILLTNLAKAYSGQNRNELAEETLWRGLQLDPNQDNGMGWYYAIQRERGGDEAAQEALRRIAAIPGSWRAQIWLAKNELQSRKLESALAIYQGCLDRAPTPIPSELLMSISGDLGNAGHLPEILNLVGPRFDVHTHGLQVGNNLIKAYVDLGQFDAARKILDELYAQNRTDWKPSLSYWDTEMAKARIAITPFDDKVPSQAQMLTTEGPVWLNKESPATELFPANAPDATLIAFLGCSAERATNSKRVQHQLADPAGRLSRALPLYFAEQVEFSTRSRTVTLVPWFTNSETSGFVLSGGPWPDDDASQHARASESKADYIVTAHMKTQTEPWQLELRLIRTIDAKCLGHLETALDYHRPEDTLHDLMKQFLPLVCEQAEVPSRTPPIFYDPPTGRELPYYLLRLEQLLALRCGTLETARPDFLNGEREIIDGNLQLCVARPQNVETRVLLAQTLIALKEVRPEILPEFKDKIALLQKEMPLTDPARGVVQRMFNEVFA